jgi:hypothetical protein
LSGCRALLASLAHDEPGRHVLTRGAGAARPSGGRPHAAGSKSHHSHHEGDTLMTAWTSEELTKIAAADEMQIAAVRRDGTLGSACGRAGAGRAGLAADPGRPHRPDPGTRRVSRLAENTATDGVELTSGQIGKLSNLTPAPGDRLAEAQMRLTGS